MYSRLPHEDIPRDLYGLPAAPPKTDTPTPAPRRHTVDDLAPGVMLPRARGLHPVVIAAVVLAGVALFAGLGAVLVLWGG
ncbi:hypothetical protein [Brevibacterium otitidis]|uniref:hypothetical protein n=1 Tax=Brevibacterium otitidis TaxID=53364 RepID=UPI00366F5D0E